MWFRRCIECSIRRRRTIGTTRTRREHRAPYTSLRYWCRVSPELECINVNHINAFCSQTTILISRIDNRFVSFDLSLKTFSQNSSTFDHSWTVDILSTVTQQIELLISTDLTINWLPFLFIYFIRYVIYRQ